MPNPLSMYAVDAVAAIAEVKGWNACRAAMLAAALQEVKQQNANTLFVINKSQVCIYANDNQKETGLH
ncbi:hypothetical protein GSE35_23780 [Klebsiella variicola]|nr:hypothetical protein [Klebsiella variicola]